MKKLDFILETADFSYGKDGWLCGSCSIVGTLAGTGFDAPTKEEAAQLMVEYFDRNVNFDGNSVVKSVLTDIGWKSDCDEINVSESYLKDNMISKIISEEFIGNGFSSKFVNNKDALRYAFETLFHEYTEDSLKKQCDSIFNVQVASYEDAMEKIEKEQFTFENWENLGYDKHDLTSYFRKYYDESYDREELCEILSALGN